MPRTKLGLVRLIGGLGLRNPRIADAFRAIDRADFVPEELRPAAYLDRPVGIPHEQTTSQPSLIAHMLDAAAPKDFERALEVGTGYGFQTALLAHLCAEVVTIERWAALAERARDNLRRAGIVDVDVRTGDGFGGAPDKAPFDVIIVSAAADRVPGALAAQMAEGGRMVIPIREFDGDNVYLYVKRGAAVERTRLVAPARFVPLLPGSPE